MSYKVPGLNIWTNMTPVMKKHMKAICSDSITKSNVIGLRKIINAQWRKDRGYSVSRVSPNITREEVQDLIAAMDRNQPKVIGELHDSGLKLLQDRRYRKRLKSVADVIANLDCFRLIGFQEAGEYGGHHVPVYRAIAKDGSKFTFYNVPWQSGGDGPQLVMGGFSGPTS
jgi:hypothetical protein